MSSEILLRATGLSKVYSGSKKPLSTLWHALFGSTGGSADKYPVLRDIDIEVRRGETVGIMGRNGAGKTTLLGILGNVIQPTTGVIERHGRTATLLGLTAGFNPNFSGRENAYLFCSIQGLSRRQTDDRIDDIEKFAALGRYFELPLQSYSSGMQSRLAFACAVHVSADLIIIDETLAVGDANFRMKCYDRIRQMKQDGQTFLLVSHNSNLVANFCSRGIVLEGGQKIFDGTTFDAVEAYKQLRTEVLMDGSIERALQAKSLPSGDANQDARLLNIRLAEDGAGSGARVVVAADLTATRDLENVMLSFGIRNHQGIAMCSWDGSRGGIKMPSIRQGKTYPVEFIFHKHLLPGRFFFTASVHEIVGDVSKPLGIYQNCLSFDVAGEPDGPMTGTVDLQMQARIGHEANDAPRRAGDA
jgi:ABC-type polysaccharide/polyol phosphate transport system ATPase subunit